MPLVVRSKRSEPSVSKPAVEGAQKGENVLGLPKPPPGHIQKPAGVSLCMIVKNEERFLDQCLRSAADVVDETIVVDTGSTDRTVEIAKKFGATVIYREWRNDFAWARNQALEAATYRWILVLDADEELMANSKPILRQLKTAPAAHTALWARLYNRSDDYHGTGEMSHALIRVFPNDERIRYRGLIHEFPTLDGDPNGLKGVSSAISIVHHGYVKEIVQERDKGQRNLAIVRAAAEAEPDEPYHWFNLGATAFLTEDFETARDALERMRTMLAGQTRGFVPNGLAVLAETYCDKLGDPVKGEEVARDGLIASPHYANAHFQLGKALIAQKRFDEGRAAYEAAIDDGKYAAMQYVIDDQVYIWKSHSEIGSSYVIQGDDRNAVEWFEKGLKNAPNAEPLHINRAKALERLGRIEEARDGYARVYEMYHSQQATIEYVNFLLRQHRETEAVSVIEESYAGMPPDQAVPLLMAAAAVAQRRNSRDDERYLRAAAALMPGAADVLDPLETLLRERGKAGDVDAFVLAEEAVPPKSAADYLRRARRRLNDRRFEEGLDYAARGLALDASNKTLYYARAFAEANLGFDERALATLAEIDGGPADLMLPVFALGASLHSKLGRPGDALDWIDGGLRVDPSRYDLWLQRASICEQAGDDDGCEDALKRAFELEKAESALRLSSFYLKKQRFTDAAAVAERALS